MVPRWTTVGFLPTGALHIVGAMYRRHGQHAHRHQEHVCCRRRHRCQCKCHTGAQAAMGTPLAPDLCLRARTTGRRLRLGSACLDGTIPPMFRASVPLVHLGIHSPVMPVIARTMLFLEVEVWQHQVEAAGGAEVKARSAAALHATSAMGGTPQTTVHTSRRIVRNTRTHG